MRMAGLDVVPHAPAWSVSTLTPIPWVALTLSPNLLKTKNEFVGAFGSPPIDFCGLALSLSTACCLRLQDGP